MGRKLQVAGERHDYSQNHALHMFVYVTLPYGMDERRTMVSQNFLTLIVGKTFGRMPIRSTFFPGLSRRAGRGTGGKFPCE
jgi:hypothetical protein